MACWSIHRNLVQLLQVCVAAPPGASSLGEAWNAWQRRSFKGMPGPRSCRRRMILEKMQRRNNIQSFQNLIQSQKALRRVLMLKKVLASHPNRTMQASELGRELDAAGLMMQRKAVYLLSKYPSIFKMSQNPLWERPFVQFTEEAEAVVEEEEALMRSSHRMGVVERLTKILMMCGDRRLPVEDVCRMESELWLPADFKARMVHEYPQFFRAVEREGVAYVELTEWDESLAMTAREMDSEEKPMQSKTGKKLPYGFQLHYARGHRPGLKKRQEMNKWQELPFISPYQDLPADSNPMSMEFAKRSVAVAHEFLSLTLEKRSSVELLDSFRKQLRLPCRLLHFFHKHYAIFYVADKGQMHALFLKEAYRAIDHPKKVAHLIRKEAMVEIQEKVKELMMRSRESRSKIPGLARRE